MALRMKKENTERDVLQAASERMDLLYKRFDRVTVGFSGGKDSTACLNLAIASARKFNRLPVEAIFYDEEMAYPTTIEYVERVRQNPDVKLYWYCLPMEQRNTCSREFPTYHAWDPDLRHLWCREPPECALFDLPLRNDLKREPHSTSMAFAILPNSPKENIVMVLGIRAQESMRRRQAVSHREHENWIMQTPHPGSQVQLAYPIYDWSMMDVWFYPQLHGFDYNRTYELFDLAGLPMQLQRVSPPWGEESVGILHMYQVLAPDLWAKMVKRCPGVGTAARYARTELWSFRINEPPPGLTYREWTFRLLDLWPEGEYREKIKASIARLMAMHARKTQTPIPDSTPDPITSLSWKSIAMIANRGDIKGRKAQMIATGAMAKMFERGEDAHAIMADAASKVGTRY